MDTHELAEEKLIVGYGPLADFLTDNGYPLSKSTMSKYCSPAIDTGPPVEAYWGMAELARVATFLASEGIALNNEAHARFVDAVADNLYHAIHLLERRAQGDYSPDTTPESFPPFINGPARKSAGPGSWELFEAFVKATQPAPKTVQRWCAVFREMQRQFADVGERDHRGRDSVVGQGLGHCRALCAYSASGVAVLFAARY